MLEGPNFVYELLPKAVLEGVYSYLPLSDDSKFIAFFVDILRATKAKFMPSRRGRKRRRRSPSSDISISSSTLDDRVSQLRRELVPQISHVANPDQSAIQFRRTMPLKFQRVTREKISNLRPTYTFKSKLESRHYEYPLSTSVFLKKNLRQVLSRMKLLPHDKYYLHSFDVTVNHTKMNFNRNSRYYKNLDRECKNKDIPIPLLKESSVTSSANHLNTQYESDNFSESLSTNNDSVEVLGPITRSKSNIVNSFRVDHSNNIVYSSDEKNESDYDSNIENIPPNHNNNNIITNKSYSYICTKSKVGKSKPNGTKLSKKRLLNHKKKIVPPKINKKVKMAPLKRTILTSKTYSKKPRKSLRNFGSIVCNGNRKSQRLKNKKKKL